ncbi:hypothetical protein HAX54_004560 [Datura stramonium]|uniref:Uncharacterized protein n=1 Tax=Datura stramonium TaxID=4076 RepID=A0ABS8T882_DATST|nr:hypothetical protein [Datura stramonium]
MRMEAEQQQYHSWKLNVQAKAKNLDFKLVASNFLPNCRYFPFSLKFKYCRFFIHLKSQTFTSPNPKKPKFLEIKTPSVPRETCTHDVPRTTESLVSKTKEQGNRLQSSVVLGNLALFIQSIYQGDKDGIYILGSIVFVCFASLFKNFMARKAWTLLVFLIGALVFCSNVMHLGFRSQFDHHYLFGFFWRAFKNAVSSACLYVLSHVLTAISRLI